MRGVAEAELKTLCTFHGEDSPEKSMKERKGLPHPIVSLSGEAGVMIHVVCTVYYI